MATRTQMLQESRSQSVVGMNKYLKLFQDMRPPLFKACHALMKGKCHLLHLSWMEKHKGSREGNMKTKEEKCYRFQSGLKDDIRQHLIPFEIEDYSILVERDRRVEIDF
ncbi:hypothetical protein IEQ34_018005 [Dendrobium chrysotoxum]|uniref:Uncharacterized protein n=1 Tax=Dendrobium chrysotoxum TaxID=161865 RepID=A0AAV7GBU7_DENCH|nr:hypothetical protein IEQ34_018005 [Dendrobium chrysotoxum]